jgi:hypothetical protein
MMELKFNKTKRSSGGTYFLIPTQYGTEGILFQPLAVSCRKHYLFENFTRNENPPFIRMKKLRIFSFGEHSQYSTASL